VDAEKALVFKARFASNLVSAADGASHPSAEITDSTPARSSSLPPTPATQVATTAANKRAPEVSVNSAHGQPYVVFEGTTIDTVLTNRLDGEFAGPVKVMVTDAVYSQDRQHLLIPEGTFLLVNNHYLEIFGTSIALGVIAGAAESSNANAGYTQSGSDAYKAGVASSLSQSSTSVLDRFINIPPTITIREGHRIKVYITQDMLLPAYENHTIPGDI
jgi:type IV secretion system protein VirB10